MHRRKFLIGSSSFILATVAGGSYVFSGCPLDDGTGVCTGPCSAFIDLNGDGFCDRLPPPSAPAVGDGGLVAAGEAASTIQRACPFGLLDDPFPGECNLYVDIDGDGICDLSQNYHLLADVAPSAQAPAEEGEGESVAQPLTILTACPLGLVNDPFPGECRHYVDEDGNGICDLSEPSLIASGHVSALPTPSAEAEDVSSASRPQTACPYGLVNDPYPGECRYYVDANGNGLCDLSEPALVESGVVSAPSGDASSHSGGGGGGGGGDGDGDGGGGVGDGDGEGGGGQRRHGRKDD